MLLAAFVCCLCITLRCAPGNNLVKSYFSANCNNSNNNSNMGQRRHCSVQLKLFAFNTRSPTQRRLAMGRRGLDLTWTRTLKVSSTLAHTHEYTHNPWMAQHCWNSHSHTHAVERSSRRFYAANDIKSYLRTVYDVWRLVQVCDGSFRHNGFIFDECHMGRTRPLKRCLISCLRAKIAAANGFKMARKIENLRTYIHINTYLCRTIFRKGI